MSRVERLNRGIGVYGLTVETTEKTFYDTMYNTNDIVTELEIAPSDVYFVKNFLYPILCSVAKKTVQDNNVDIYLKGKIKIDKDNEKTSETPDFTAKIYKTTQPSLYVKDMKLADILSPKISLNVKTMHEELQEDLFSDVMLRISIPVGEREYKDGTTIIFLKNIILIYANDNIIMTESFRCVETSSTSVFTYCADTEKETRINLDSLTVSSLSYLRLYKKLLQETIIKNESPTAKSIVNIYNMMRDTFSESTIRREYLRCGRDWLRKREKELSKELDILIKLINEKENEGKE